VPSKTGNMEDSTNVQDNVLKQASGLFPSVVTRKRIAIGFLTLGFGSDTHTACRLNCQQNESC
jgi:hypothetical protein